MVLDYLIVYHQEKIIYHSLILLCLNFLPVSRIKNTSSLQYTLIFHNFLFSLYMILPVCLPYLPFSQLSHTNGFLLTKLGFSINFVHFGILFKIFEMVAPLD